MKHTIDDELRNSAREFELRFRCEHCAYFSPTSGTCSNGYPNEEHRARDLIPGETLCFCKEFELK